VKQALAPFAEAGLGAGPIPALIVTDDERRRLEMMGPVRERLIFCDRNDQLRKRLEGGSPPAVVIETRDADGYPVPAAIRAWVERHPGIPIVVWTAGGEGALREVLDLAAAGGDVRLILRRRGHLATALDNLIALPSQSHPGAVPALLRGVVLGAPSSIQPELTLAAYHSWPQPSVRSWAESLHVTRQTLNARLGAASFAAPSIILDCFSAAEIAMRCTLGIKLKQIAVAMGKRDERSLRYRLGLLGCRPEELNDEADFRALIPRIVEAVKR